MLALLRVRCHAPSMFEGSRPLLESTLQDLNDHRYVVCKNWLSAAQTDEIRDDVLACDAFGSAINSHVGNTNGMATLDLTTRRSRHCPLYPPPSNAAGSVDTRARLIRLVNGLRSELQASATMSLPRMAPFETEIIYLLYPVGGHYKRHLDVSLRQDGWKLQGRAAHDGGSFCGGQTRRVVSFILYLNRQWDPKNGGELRVYPAHDHGDGSAQSEQAGFTEDITPEGGTLVLVMSGDVEHMVRETRAERQCVVGWFHEYREERVPNLDAMLQHSEAG